MMTVTNVFAESPLAMKSDENVFSVCCFAAVYVARWKWLSAWEVPKFTACFTSFLLPNRCFLYSFPSLTLQCCLQEDLWYIMLSKWYDTAVKTPSGARARSTCSNSWNRVCVGWNLKEVTVTLPRHRIPNQSDDGVKLPQVLFDLIFFPFEIRRDFMTLWKTSALTVIPCELSTRIFPEEKRSKRLETVL